MGQQPRALDPTSSAPAFFGARLRAWRIRRRLSQAQLGRLIHSSADLIAKIEKAERRAHPDLIDRLDAVLEAEGDLTALAVTLTFPARKAVPTEPASVLSAFKVVQDGAGREAVMGMRQVLGGLRRVDHSLGSGAALTMVVAQQEMVKPLVATTSGSLRGEVLSLLAELFQLEGWLNFDRADLTAADACLVEARKWAEAANDEALVAYILGPTHGFAATYSGQLALGRARSEIALRWARRSGNRRLISFVLAVGARSEAKLGERRRCLEMLDEAGEELLNHEAPSPDPPWLMVFDEAALRGHRGSCFLDLGSPEQAIEPLTEQDAAAPGLFVRNRVIWLLDRADAYLGLNEVEEACASVRQAWESASGTSSPRVARRLTATMSSLDRQGMIPEVAAIQELLREVPVG